VWKSLFLFKPAEVISNTVRLTRADHRIPGEQPLKPRGVPSRPVFDQATLDAIELVGNFDAQNMIDNGTLPNYVNSSNIATLKSRVIGRENMTKQQDTNPHSWWPRNVDHTGHMAFGDNSSYKVCEMIWSFHGHMDVIEV
jgi:hypothetical protein